MAWNVRPYFCTGLVRRDNESSGRLRESGPAVAGLSNEWPALLSSTCGAAEAQEACANAKMSWL